MSGGRRGRRPGGGSGPRARIVRAATQTFASSGYAGASLRQVAGAAGVDPALVHYYFATKDALFRECLRIDVAPTIPVALLGGPTHQLGEWLVATYFSMWREPTTGLALQAAVNSRALSDHARMLLDELIPWRVLGEIWAHAGSRGEDSAVVVSWLLLGAVIAKEPDEAAMRTLREEITRLLPGRRGAKSTYNPHSAGCCSIGRHAPMS